MVTHEALLPYLDTALEVTDFQHLGERYVGKVRDVYTRGDRTILIATDRQSAFDLPWCSIPLKGQVLNQISTWWFKRVADIMPSHIIEIPDENVAVVKNLQMLPIEIVVRAYLAGSTETSAWMNYKKGVRNLCGNKLPEGMVKNQRFESGPIITPTTKGERDESIDSSEIVRRGLVSGEQWNEISQKAMLLFRRGQEIAESLGLILVDTKYEMGFDSNGILTLADEVHTPDSSRYWIADSYLQRMAASEEPESLDKEFFRLWLREQGFDYGQPKPVVSNDARIMLALKYIDLYRRITGEDFVLPTESNVVARIGRNLEKYSDQSS